MTVQSGRPDFPGTHFHIAGHDLHVVHLPQDRLGAVLWLIARAEKSIQMFFYMFGDDATGREVRDALVTAANNGVHVQLIIDSFGSGNVSDRFFDALVEAGGCYHCFSTRKGLGYIIRNHQKILIADSAHALVGGFNITDDYFGRAGDNSWEDLGIIVSGAQAQKLSDYFEDLARASNNGKVRYSSIRNIIHQWRPGIGQVQWLLGGPTNRISPWAITFKRSLEAGKRVDIVSAYFSPSQTILRRIAKAAKHNKGSRLVVAGKTDNNATIAAARLLYRYLIRRKARIFEFQSRPLHMKLMVIDDTVYIGSANLDVRSMFINLEIMVRIKDAGLALHMRKLIDELVTQSEEQTRILLKARDSYWSRFKAALAYFLVNSVDYTIGRRITFGLIRNR
ncbi:MAG: phosphatidylserine/phosphatidylglycerophosphate/cardiolipin synthase family protein [Sphingorhabdus sp.]|jgi:cardiolipin synthase A/B|uniref:phospholipase D-like domain-containing protein n=1 Tax=Sphingorhabdus sp. TaxID=1902408 RepID=UPI00273DBD77|nr:phosphatidylserine/phosphatidylglycerophosphate/cardiolipin synthase family protein [Sphingorhabdus sp.]MDP4758203.1 phosphatidylserine/phosphatidylglycerophosphate/cardiolipin synthase family protein [Sphingorhabdus sp.]MDP4872371.1 phosphatidylserine/phosphatidylglycerophosphate/cardiolipin synthase family protein [Sphingorhabdus sp.]MDP4926704.1 phosphatidylserine/phosphatidylglycerophosphate/cardiolipin synthase family protein [Sphingorhabdus sp.]